MLIIDDHKLNFKSFIIFCFFFFNLIFNNVIPIFSSDTAENSYDKYDNR
jgi:hypothetical protein